MILIIHFLTWNNIKVDSGISYYKKLLKRNLILRRVIGEEMDYYIQVLLRPVTLFLNIPTIFRNLENMSP